MNFIRFLRHTLHTVSISFQTADTTMDFNKNLTKVDSSLLRGRLQVMAKNTRRTYYRTVLRKLSLNESRPENIEELRIVRF